MLVALAAAHDVVVRTFAEASDVLGFDLWQLASSGPQEELNGTANTQPAMLAANVAVWRVWVASGGAMPAMLTGHSLGEYAALTCADALSFADAIRLVRRRGEYMQLASPPGVGGMAAILGIDDDVIADCCARVIGLGVVTPANFNSPGQVVIAGNAAAVDAAVELCKAAGAKRAVRIAMSVPSHCALMRPAADQLAMELAGVTLSAPRIPVVHNVDAQTATAPAQIRQRLIKQLYEPVQWTRCVQALATANITRVIECGPGRVLAGLIKRIDRTLNVESVNSPTTLLAGLTLAASAA